ncbi:hypothetical protein EAH80_07920 [Mycobacterium hodleri]|uniref:Uncharacterized protein n=1 Tax=Mycolicibacterium hodleri TaxID=49897 RepID=A0A502EHG9_9MYCO|nr:hypothetical protein EAH80_07920 [Mycolicibacterium hodleri]
MSGAVAAITRLSLRLGAYGYQRPDTKAGAIVVWTCRRTDCTVIPLDGVRLASGSMQWAPVGKTPASGAATMDGVQVSRSSAREHYYY